MIGSEDVCRQIYPAQYTSSRFDNSTSHILELSVTTPISTFDLLKKIIYPYRFRIGNGIGSVYQISIGINSIVDFDIL